MCLNWIHLIADVNIATWGEEELFQGGILLSSARCLSNIFNIFQMFSTFSNISILLKNCQIFPWYFPGRNTPLLAKIKFQYSWTSLIFLLLHIFNYFQMFQYSCRSLICFCLHIFQLLSNILILKCLNIFQIFEKYFPKIFQRGALPPSAKWILNIQWNETRGEGILFTPLVKWILEFLAFQNVKQSVTYRYRNRYRKNLVPEKVSELKPLFLLPKFWN